MSSSDKTVRVLKADTETLLRSKDEEYACWQSRPPLERLATMQQLGCAFLEEPAIFVAPDKANLEAVYAALLCFGAPLKNVDKNQFLTPGAYYRMGAPPGQVDIFSRIPGVRFETCWPARVEVRLDEESAAANVISAEHLIAAKIASGREQDLAGHKKGAAAKTKDLGFSASS